MQWAPAYFRALRRAREGCPGIRREESIPIAGDPGICQRMTYKRSIDYRGMDQQMGSNASNSGHQPLQSAKYECSYI